MNWNLIAWVAGTLLTIYAIKFVFLAIRSLFSKDTMTSVMDAMGNSVARANRKFNKFLKEKAKKTKIESEKNNTPTVIIR